MIDATGYPDELAYLVTLLGNNIDDLTGALESGEIDPDEWAAQIGEDLSTYHMAAYMAGAQVPMIPEAEILVKNYIRTQLGFLDNFKLVIQNSPEFMAGWLPRAEMYGNGIASSYWTGVTKMQPLPAMPGDGTTQCLSRCKCLWEIVTVDEDANDYDAFWVLGAAEHCQTCIERGKLWSPLQIRGGILQLKEFTPADAPGIWTAIYKHMKGQHDQEHHGWRGVVENITNRLFPHQETYNVNAISAQEQREYKTGSETDITGSGEWKTWNRKLSSDQKKALNAYTGSEYSLNNSLRAGRTPANFAPINQKFVQLMDGATSMPLSQDTVLFRGIAPRAYSTDAQAAPGGWVDTIRQKNVSVGSTFTDHGYSSTSIDENTARGFAQAGGIVFKISAPQGTRGAYPSSLSVHKGEGEFIAARNTKFMITKIVNRLTGETVSNIEYRDAPGKSQVAAGYDIELMIVGQGETALKHLKGQHNQKRHGWRYSANIPLSKLRDQRVNGGGWDYKPETEWNAYTKRVRARHGTVSAATINAKNKPPAPPPPPAPTIPTTPAPASIQDTTAAVNRHYMGIHETDLINEQQYLYWAFDLTPQERAAIDDYTGSGYHVNQSLRTGSEQEQYSLYPQSKFMVEGMDTATHSYKLERDTLLSRGIYAPKRDANALPGGWDDAIANHNVKPGTVFQDHGFTSTSIILTGSQWVGRDIKFNVKAPKGTMGAYVEKVGGYIGEKEFVMPRRTKFMITKIVDRATGLVVNTVEQDNWQIKREYDIDLLVVAQGDVTLKHMKGQHNQKRHGWRYGGNVPLSKLGRQRSTADEGYSPADEWTQYKKRVIAKHGLETKNKLTFQVNNTKKMMERDYKNIGGDAIIHTPKYLEWRKSLSDAELDAVYKYTKGHSAIINYSHRTPGEKLTSDYKKMSDNIDAAVNKYSLEQDTKLYRGIKSYEISKDNVKDGDFGKAVLDGKVTVGSAFTDHGFASTSISKSTGNEFAADTDAIVFNIKAPKGTRGIYPDHLSHFPTEKEFLMPRNTKFIITGIRDAKGNTVDTIKPGKWTAWEGKYEIDLMIVSQGDVTLKHMKGQHNQKRHGWRYGSGTPLSRLRTQRTGDAPAEWTEFKKRVIARHGLETKNKLTFDVNKVKQQAERHYSPVTEDEIKSQDQYKKWASDLTPEHRDAIDWYAGFGFVINDNYRKGTEAEQFSKYPNNKKWTDNLDAAVSGYKLEKDTILARGIDTYAAAEQGRAGGWGAAIMEGNIKPGTVFQDHGYTSSSIKLDDTTGWNDRDIRFRISAPAGTRGGYLPGVGGIPFEQEFLMPRNTKYMITKITDRQTGKVLDTVRYNQNVKGLIAGKYDIDLLIVAQGDVALKMQHNQIIG